MKRTKEEWLIINIPLEIGADVLDQEFVDKFIKECNAKHIPTNWGAYKCVILGRTLSALHKKGLLDRFRISLGYNWQPGFPKWVYHYSLNEAGKSRKEVILAKKQSIALCEK